MAAVPQSLSEVLDNLYVSTWKIIKKDLADNIFDSTPLFAWLRMKGRIEDQVGGRHIEMPVIYRKNERVKWIKRGGTVSLADQEFMTETKWDWKFLVAPIVRFGVDDQMNRGKAQIFNYVAAKLENAQLSLEDNLETTLFASTTTDGFDGLQKLVADAPGTGVVGNIDPNLDSFWRNKFQTMASSSFGTNGVNNMRAMVNNTSQNKKNDRPDIIISGQDPYEYYEDAILGKYQFENKALADLGFQSQTFKGIAMTWSPANTDRMYFLNTRYLKVIRDPGLWFDMTPWKDIPNQVNDKAAQIISALAFVTNRRRVQGVIFSIDTV